MLQRFQQRLVKLHFHYSAGEFLQTVDVANGTTLRDAAINNGIDVEGACGGKCKCATCHMILPPEFFKLLPKPKEQEEDMLDIGVAVTSHSRLGCQVQAMEALDGMKITLPHLDKLLVRK